MQRGRRVPGDCLELVEQPRQLEALSLQIQASEYAPRHSMCLWSRRNPRSRTANNRVCHCFSRRLASRHSLPCGTVSAHILMGAFYCFGLEWRRRSGRAKESRKDKCLWLTERAPFSPFMAPAAHLTMLAHATRAPLRLFPVEVAPFASPPPRGLSFRRGASPVPVCSPVSCQDKGERYNEHRRRDHIHDLDEIWSCKTMPAHNAPLVLLLSFQLARNAASGWARLCIHRRAIAPRRPRRAATSARNRQNAAACRRKGLLACSPPRPGRGDAAWSVSQLRRGTI